MQTAQNIKNNLNHLFNDLAKSIHSNFENSKVIIFGSYARNEQTIDSDLDICVLIPYFKQDKLQTKLALRKAINNTMPIGLDILVFTYDEYNEAINKQSYIQYEINREGVTIDGKS